MTTRAARRAQQREVTSGKADQTAFRQGGTGPGAARTGRLRVVAFLAIVAIVIGAGLYYAGSVFFVRPPGADASMPMGDVSSIVAPASGAINFRVSMAGFEPGVVKAKPGQELTFDWWNTDGAMHLEGGVHTMVSDTLGIRFELPAESHRTIAFKAPTTPGSYDYWCDSCCGGKDNPGMHARIEVEA